MGLTLSSRLSLRLAGGAGWTPAALGSSLLGWWDAERTDKLTLSGSSVSTWTDVVGGYAATQGVSGSKPSWDANAFGGRPGVIFDGADDELTLGSVPFPVGANASEIWALVDQQAPGADVNTRAFFTYGDVTNTSRRAQRYSTGGANRLQSVVGSGAANVGADVIADFSGRCVARVIVSGTDTTAAVNGTSGSAQAVIPSTATSRTRLGATSASTAANFWQGQINTVIVTNPLSTGQAAQLLAYLKARGGIA